jgi:hypothetical protein
MFTPTMRQWMLVADWLAVGVAVSLPWSTSATSILLVLWVVAVLPTLTVEALRRELASAAGLLPVLLWLFGALGMFWADVPWHDRFAGLEGFHRLLAVPILFVQFRRSDLGTVVLYGYLVSAMALLLTSWTFALVPPLQTHGNFYGVPVKDYIYQAGEFLICGFVLLGAAAELRARQSWRVVVTLIVVAVLFLADDAFVITSRTSILVVPCLVAALGWRLSGWKGVAAACLIGAVLGPALWFSSPHLRDFTLQSVADLRSYFISNAVTSSGMHFEFIRKSVSIVANAPVIGHGTGSITEEFRRAAAGETGAGSVVTVNPHNQVFAVAIQLGYVGAAILIAMWLSHFALFVGSGWVAWAGLVVVIENVVSSAVNSHLFDFSQGWLYVFGVGVAGALVKRERDRASGGAAA